MKVYMNYYGDALPIDPLPRLSLNVEEAISSIRIRYEQEKLCFGITDCPDNVGMKGFSCTWIFDDEGGYAVIHNMLTGEAIYWTVSEITITDNGIVTDIKNGLSDERMKKAEELLTKSCNDAFDNMNMLCNEFDN